MSVTLLLTDPADAIRRAPCRCRSPGVASAARAATSAPSRSRSMATHRCCRPRAPASTSPWPATAPNRSAISFSTSSTARLFSDKRRDGYLHVDPHDPAAARAMFEAPTSSASSRSRVTWPTTPAFARTPAATRSASNCLEVRPTARSRPSATTCDRSGDLRRLRQLRGRLPDRRGELRLPAPRGRDRPCRHLLSAYRAAGGARPILLAHDEKHGGELISAMARFGRGLLQTCCLLCSTPCRSSGTTSSRRCSRSAPSRSWCWRRPTNRPSSLRSGRRRGWRRRSSRASVTRGRASPSSSNAIPTRSSSALYDLPVLPATRPQRFTARGTKRDFARTALAKLREAAPTRPTSSLCRAARPTAASASARRLHAVPGVRRRLPHERARRQSRSPRGQLHRGRLRAVRHLRGNVPGKRDLARAALRLHARRARAGGAEGRGAVPLQALRQAVRHAVLGREGDGAPQGHSMFRAPGQLDVIGMCDDCRVITMAESRRTHGAWPVRASARRTITSPPR